MSGIAGIAQAGRQELVERMLDKLAHRGPAGREVVETDGVTLGVAWARPQSEARVALAQTHTAQDQRGAGHCASAQAAPQGLSLN